MSTTRRVVVGCVGVLALVATLAACGSSSKKATSNTQAAASSSGGSGGTSAAATGSPIKIGEMCDCSGAFGPNDSGGHAVFDAWVKSVNASGGLDGHPIVLTSEDDQSNPAVSTTDLQKLVSDHVAVILDLSSFDGAWASAAEAAKIPVVGGTYNLPAYGTNPDFYPSGGTEDASLYAVAATAKLAGASTIGSLYCLEVPSCAQQPAAVKAAGATMGLKAVYSAAISATAPSYTALCVAAQQAKAQALYAGISAETGVSLGSDCDRQGYDPIYVLQGLTYQDSLAKSKMGQNLWMPFSGEPYWDKTPAIEAMNAAVDKYHPGLRQGKGGVWSGVGAEAWTGGLLIRDAVKGSGVGPSGTVTAATITQGLNSIKNDTLDGTSPPLTFTAGQGHKVDCWFTGKVIHGVPSTITANGTDQVSCHNM